MAGPATIARPYAEALYQAWYSDADADGDASWVDELAAVAADPQVRQLIDHPKVTPEQLFGVLTGAMSAQLPKKAENFLHVVIDNGRVAALPEIAAQFHVLVNESKGSRDAVVYSAFAINKKSLTELGKVLEKRFGQKLNLSVEIDKSLIGGIRVVVGDEVLDTSVKAQLDQMNIALTA